jgi:hypothetical protein
MSAGGPLGDFGLGWLRLSAPIIAAIEGGPCALQTGTT